MKLKMIPTYGVLTLWMSLAATAEETVIELNDPDAAASKILDIFESKLESRPYFLAELLAEDRDRVERLLRAAQKDRPTARLWALDVQELFAADVAAGKILEGEKRVAHFKHALEYLQESYAIAMKTLEKSPDKELQAVLPGLRLDLARAALEAGELELAKKHAGETLRQNTDRENWNYGNIIHDANQVLGRCALREEKLDAAKKHLLAAGATPGSPQLNSFGPQMRLAREMLDRSEKETVLQYLELVAKFWAPRKEPTELQVEHARRLAGWKREIEEGKIPAGPKWHVEGPPAGSVDALLKDIVEPSVKHVLGIFDQAEFENEDDVRAAIQAAADSPVSVSYIHLAWSVQSELHQRDFAQFVLSETRRSLAVPVTTHFIDCTPITQDYSALHDLPGWDKEKGGPAGWGEVLWMRNGRVVHFERMDRFATTDELVAKTAELFGRGGRGRPRQDERQIKPFDGRCEAPMPPEEIASLVDEAIEEHGNEVTLTLVRHPKPTTQPAGARTAWVCTAKGKPLWAIASRLDKPASKNGGVTARALSRARKRVAEHMEMEREFVGKGKLTPSGWQPMKEALLPAYQSKEYGLQITRIEFEGRKKGNWKITFEPIKEAMGGEVWVYGKGDRISLEFGK